MAKKRNRLTRKQMRALGTLVAALIAGVLGIGSNAMGNRAPDAAPNAGSQQQTATAQNANGAATLASVPAYSGEPWIAIAASDEYPNGKPTFTDSEVARAERGAFERYSPLDALGRCGTALACVGKETMPTAKRKSISSVHPSGWRQRFYDFVEQEALYNRCHLIAHSLAAEDANDRNLITGTRSLNVHGMLPFEEKTLAYIRETGNHVLYRATPIFDGDNLVASGVHLEARSVEDGGKGICFNVYCYNVQPGVNIDYATGESWEE